MSLAGQASILPVAVLVLLAGAIAALVVGRFSGAAAGLVSFVALVAAGVMLALAAPAVYQGHLLVHQVGGWMPLRGTVLAIGWAADPFGMTYALAATFIGAMIVLVGIGQMGGFHKRELGQLWCLTLLLVAGLVGCALTADLFNLFVWFELASVASYGLTAFHLGRPSALEGAFKIVVLTTAAGFLVFIGIGMLYGRLGALNFGQLHNAIAAGVPGGGGGREALGAAGVVALALLVAGFATKAGLVPLHTWLPDAHSVAPGPVSALFSGLMVTMGVVAIARITALVVPAHVTSLHGTLVVLGATSAVVGSAMAFGQDELKRLLGYDTVAQMGLITLALGLASHEADAGATWHLLNHALFKSLLFLVAGAIVHLMGTEKLSEMGGLARRYPALATAFVVGVLSIIGVPPFNGYASRVLIHDAIAKQHEWVTLAAVELAEFLSAAALLRATWQAFFAAPSEHVRSQSHRRLSPVSVVGLTALGGGCLAFGLFPTKWLGGIAEPAAGVLSSPDRYADAVTHGAQAVVRFAPAHIPGSFASPEVAISTACVLVFGALAAWWRIRTDADPAPIAFLRRLHTGSINDYATYWLIGVAVLVLAVSR